MQQRDGDLDAGALARRGIELNGAMHLTHALSHADQAQSSTVHGMIHVEALACIGDEQSNLFACTDETDLNGRAGVVTDGILHRFLNYAVEAERDIDTHIARHIVLLEMNGDAGLERDFAAEGACGHDRYDGRRDGLDGERFAQREVENHPPLGA